MNYGFCIMELSQILFYLPAAGGSVLIRQIRENPCSKTGNLFTNHSEFDLSRSKLKMPKNALFKPFQYFFVSLKKNSHESYSFTTGFNADAFVLPER